MFSKTYFNKYVERCAETQESFFTAIENKDYVAARSFLDKQFNLIHTMRKLGRNAYEELASSHSPTRTPTPTSSKADFLLTYWI